MLISNNKNRFFAELHGLKEYDIDLKEAGILEFYVSQYWWVAREKAMSAEQISTYYSIIHELFNGLKGTITVNNNNKKK